MTETRPPARLVPAPPVMTASDLVEATGGTLLARSDRPIRGGSVDSRQVQPGNLFVALPGERVDGHQFLADAARAGAAALLVSRPPDDLAALGDVTVVLVPDALDGLHRIAGAWRARFEPLVVGVTGSIAKTSTKEAIAAVLAARFRTLRSEGNQNNEIGLPLTLLRMGPEHEAAVLEMGMYVGGEIATLARLARPTIGVVTAVREVHLSRIGTIDAVERAKGELVEALPQSGTAVLNADDERVARMRSRTKAAVLSYGFSSGADVRAERIESRGLDGMSFDLVADARDPVAGVGSRRVSIPTLGRHAVHNALAAAAVGFAAGLTLDEVEGGLGRIATAEHRGEIVRASGLTILDDAYNASPSSVAAALDLLVSLPGRHVAVLGEMLELGDAHERGHREVGAMTADGVDLLVVVGAGAALIGEAAIEAGLSPARLVATPDRDAALAILRARVRDGDVVLVKASRGAALEELVTALAGSRGAAAGVREVAEPEEGFAERNVAPAPQAAAGDPDASSRPKARIDGEANATRQPKARIDGEASATRQPKARIDGEANATRQLKAAAGDPDVTSRPKARIDGEASATRQPKAAAGEPGVTGKPKASRDVEAPT